MKWTCNGRVLDVDATDARKLARYLRQQFGVTFSKTPAAVRDPAKEAQVFAWTARMDELGKACLKNRRLGLVPRAHDPQQTVEQLIAAATRPAKGAGA